MHHRERKDWRFRGLEVAILFVFSGTPSTVPGWSAAAPADPDARAWHAAAEDVAPAPEGGLGFCLPGGCPVGFLIHGASPCGGGPECAILPCPAGHCEPGEGPGFEDWQSSIKGGLP